MKKKIAFICVHNSCRSQIAEALGRHFMSDKYDFYSAGTQIKPQINSDAVRLVKKIYGIDMTDMKSKLISDIPKPDIIISMGCDVACPVIDKGFDDNWQLEDPTGKDDAFFSAIISLIEKKVRSL